MTAGDSGQDDVLIGGLSTGRQGTRAPDDTHRSTDGGKSSVLRLRGLPFAASDSDVQSFFSGYELVEVYICRRDGERLAGPKLGSAHNSLLRCRLHNRSTAWTRPKPTNQSRIA